MRFKPPGRLQRLRALGSLDGLTKTLSLALTPDSAFEPMVEPGPGDWLAFHNEAGQTFEEFRRSRFPRPDRRKSKIYLLPLGHFPAVQSPSLHLLEQFATAFFSMAVQVDAPVPLEDIDFKVRMHPETRRRQILAPDILHFLASRTPPDAFCVLGITMEDLYPDPDWNFVFGVASSELRTGVYSFARYSPAFYGEPVDAGSKALILKRCCKVLAHETAHMFGLLHCIYYRCPLNGSNNLEESDRRPMHLCPVCLRKLHVAADFDVIDRYRRLLEFYGEVRFEQESRWVEGQLRRITQGGIE